LRVLNNPGTKVGVQLAALRAGSWIPAFAGMTMNEGEEMRGSSPRMTMNKARADPT
jgi:hypothetical protein